MTGWPGRGRKPRRERSTEPGPGVEAAELLLGDRRSSKEEALGDGSGSRSLGAVQQGTGGAMGIGHWYEGLLPCGGAGGRGSRERWGSRKMNVVTYKYNSQSRSVQLTCDEHFSNVIFATDCQSLVNRINASTFDRSITGTVVNDIRVSSSIFDSVEFKCVHRQVNVAAHILAKSCKYLPSLVVFHSTPEYIRETLCTFILSN